MKKKPHYFTVKIKSTNFSAKDFALTFGKVYEIT
jgi:hypothetical protein